MRNEKIRCIMSALMVTVLISASGCTLSLNSDKAANSSTSISSEETKSGDITQANSYNYSNSKSLFVTGVKDFVALRETDNDNSTVLAQLELGTEVQLLGEDSPTCYYVYYEAKNLTGYIKSNYLTDEEFAVCKCENWFTAKQTPLYDTNDSDQNEMQQLEKNTAIVVISKNSGDYWYVNVKDTKTFGFVKCTEISSQKSEEKTSSKKQNTASKAGNTNRQGYFTGYGNAPSYYTTYYAKVEKNYLAIRSGKSYDSSNELGRLYTGDTVYVVDSSTGQYWYCYSPYLGIYGYIDSGYLVTNKPSGSNYYSGSNNYTVWTVDNVKNYLALRTSPAYNASNEIAKLYVGDVVYVYSYSYSNFTDTYWYVYSPAYGWGYVDSNYIFS